MPALPQRGTSRPTATRASGDTSSASASTALVPDLVALFEDSGIAEVVVARPEDDRPVCATLSVPGTGASGMSVGSPASAGRWTGPGLDASQRAGGTGMVDFIFVNAARPVILQRYALAHAFAHLVLGHGDVVDARIEWSRATPPEAEANDFAEEFLAPVNAVSRWYDRRLRPAAVLADVLLDLADFFGITAWAALYRSRAAGRLGRKPQALLTRELRRRQWTLLPEQSFRGGLRDTLSTLSEEAPLLPPGAVGIGGVPAPVIREGGATPVPGDHAAPGESATATPVPGEPLRPRRVRHHCHARPGRAPPRRPARPRPHALLGPAGAPRRPPQPFERAAAALHQRQRPRSRPTRASRRRIARLLPPTSGAV